MTCLLYRPPRLGWDVNEPKGETKNKRILGQTLKKKKRLCLL